MHTEFNVHHRMTKAPRTVSKRTRVGSACRKSRHWGVIIFTARYVDNGEGADLDIRFSGRTPQDLPNYVLSDIGLLPSIYGAVKDYGTPVRHRARFLRV